MSQDHAHQSRAMPGSDRAQSDTGHDATVAILRSIRQAAKQLQFLSLETKRAVLHDCADKLLGRTRAVLASNAVDVAQAQSSGLSPTMIDRLLLTEERIEGIAQSMRDIAEQPDPVGSVQSSWTRPNGLMIERRRVPLGVLAIIFESRPNVTLDAAALCFFSGNGAILRGGKESRNTASDLLLCLHEAMQSHGIDVAAIQLMPTQDRSSVGILLTRPDLVDVVIPRGGKGLIERVYQEARVPVLAHREGLCHTYIDRGADPQMAQEIAYNAKMRRVSVCGATETLLIHGDKLMESAELLLRLHDDGCALVGCPRVVAAYPFVSPATEADWSTEYLEKKLSVRVVDSLDDAVCHINHYGSGHTDAIVTADKQAAEQFLRAVDSAIVLHNASTQFADGGEFGMGAEIGIATGRLHARGPVGAFELTTMKYCVATEGHIGLARP